MDIKKILNPYPDDLGSMYLYKKKLLTSNGFKIPVFKDHLHSLTLKRNKKKKQNIISIIIDKNNLFHFPKRIADQSRLPYIWDVFRANAKGICLFKDECIECELIVNGKTYKITPYKFEQQTFSFEIEDLSVFNIMFTSDFYINIKILNISEQRLKAEEMWFVNNYVQFLNKVVDDIKESLTQTCNMAIRTLMLKEQGAEPRKWEKGVLKNYLDLCKLFKLKKVEDVDNLTKKDFINRPTLYESLLFLREKKILPHYLDSVVKIYQNCNVKKMQDYIEIEIKKI